MPLLQSINAKRFRTFGEMALDFVKNQISCFQFTSVVVDIRETFCSIDVQDLPYWFCALCHRRETIMLESDQLEKTVPFQQ
jgi:hypothetical protein